VPVEQLVFHCDFELAPDHRLVRELTAERADICRALDLPSSAEPINVYLFRDADSYGQFLAKRFPNVPSRRAFFVESDTCWPGGWSDRVGGFAAWVAHGYLHSMVQGFPLWLDEGLAEYFEVPRGNNGLNRPHLELLSDMMQYDDWQPNLARLETLTDAAQMDQRDYAEAWAWVYFLLQSDPEGRELLTGYLADLRTVGAAESLTRLVRGRQAGADAGRVSNGPRGNGRDAVGWVEFTRPPYSSWWVSCRPTLRSPATPSDTPRLRPPC
jgi:hypothetical protein